MGILKKILDFLLTKTLNGVKIIAIIAMLLPIAKVIWPNTGPVVDKIIEWLLAIDPTLIIPATGAVWATAAVVNKKKTPGIADKVEG